MADVSSILVADEHSADRRVLEQLLSDAGYEVASVDRAEAVAQSIRERAPVVVLISETLLVEGGSDLCRVLGVEGPAAAISAIIITEEGQGTATALPPGTFDFLPRPLDPACVLARVAVHSRLVQTERHLVRKHAQLKRMAGRLNDVKAEVSTLNRFDPTTRLLNWRAWQEAVGVEHERSVRYDRAYSILMIDLDRFRSFNDILGYRAGDECLLRVTEALVRTCRTCDLIGRHGGGEFLVLAPETPLDLACTLGERIRIAICDLKIDHPAGGGTTTLTASIGLSGREFGSWEDTFRRAGEGLAIAKEAGRNRVYADHHTLLVRTDPEESESLSAAGRSDTVLVVDDQSIDRALCRRILERAGYVIIEAVDGLSALEAAERDGPNVILLDVSMPGMDGIECARRLKADPVTREIPIIMLSAHGHTRDVVAGLKSGADEYLTKPVQAAELTLRVRTMVRLHRRHQDLLQSYETRGEQARVLSVLFDFCRALASSPSLDDVLANIVAVTCDVCASQRASVMLPDGDRGVLVVAKSRGLAPEVAAEVRIPFGKGIAGQVFTSRQPLVVNSPESPELKDVEYDTRIFASVPLVSAPLGATSTVVGVLNVTDRYDRRPFMVRELRYIDLIANIAGSAIHGLLSRQSRDEARDSIVTALARLAEHRDNDTGKHVDRVTQYCLILADELRKSPKFSAVIDDSFVHNLERAAPLHDIGKVAVPDQILLKPGRLTAEEMDIMRPHTAIGAETIRSVTERAPGVGFLEMAEVIANFHHEWWDGSGYPSGLVGERIPLCARIAALADVYDALATKRVYKEAFSHDRSAAIILDSSGTQFDPEVVEAFVKREQDFIRLAAELADHDAVVSESRSTAVVVRAS